MRVRLWFNLLQGVGNIVKGGKHFFLAAGALCICLFWASPALSTTPVVTISNVSLSETTVTFSIMSNQASTAHILASTPGIFPLSESVVRIRGTTVILSANSPIEHTLTGLLPSTTYDLYWRAENNLGEFVFNMTQIITLASSGRATITGAHLGVNQIRMVFDVTEAGTAYLLASTTHNYPLASVKTLASTVLVVTTGSNSYLFSGLQSSVEYTLYVVNQISPSTDSNLSSTRVTTLSSLIISNLDTALNGDRAYLSFDSSAAADAYYFASTQSDFSLGAIRAIGANRLVVQGRNLIDWAVDSNSSYYLYVVLARTNPIDIFNVQLSNLHVVQTLRPSSDAVNQEPMADAGADISGMRGVNTVLAGLGRDSDGVIVNYLWQQTAGDTRVNLAALGEERLNTVVFNLPQSDVSAPTLTLTFELTVEDERGARDTDSVNVVFPQVIYPPSLVVSTPSLKVVSSRHFTRITRAAYGVSAMTSSVPSRMLQPLPYRREGSCTASFSAESCQRVSLDEQGRLVLVPGLYHLWWHVEDNGSLPVGGAKTQAINVLPLLSLHPLQEATAGSTIRVTGSLNGVPAIWPVNASFTVESDTSGGGLVNHVGWLRFTQGKTVASALLRLGSENGSVILRLDGSELPFVRGAPDEVLERIGLGQSLHQAIVHSENIPPIVSLDITRPGMDAQAVIVNFGQPLDISMSARDPEGNSLIVSCSASPGFGEAVSNVCADSPSPFSARVRAERLALGLHSVNFSVSDGLVTVNRTKYINVISALDDPRTRDRNGDIDGDQLANSDESLEDADDDGIPDFLDGMNANASALRIARHTAPPSRVMHVDPGLHLSLGVVARGSMAGAAISSSSFLPVVSKADLQTYFGSNFHSANAPSSTTVFFDFEIAGLRPGTAGNVVLPLLSPLPANPRFLLYSERTGWRFAETSLSNRIVSLPDAAGLCPMVDDNAWIASAELQQNHRCVYLSIADGGALDLDGQANRRIKILGGFVNATGSSVAVTSNASAALVINTGGGCAVSALSSKLPRADLLSVLAFLALGFAWRRRQFESREVASDSLTV